MKTSELTYRRTFLGRILGAAAATGFGAVGVAEAQSRAQATPATGPDAWMRSEGHASLPV